MDIVLFRPTLHVENHILFRGYGGTKLRVGAHQLQLRPFCWRRPLLRTHVHQGSHHLLLAAHIVEVNIGRIPFAVHNGGERCARSCIASSIRYR